MSDRSGTPSEAPTPSRRRKRGPLIAVICVVVAAVGAALLVPPLLAPAEPTAAPGRVVSTDEPARVVAGAAARPTRSPSPSSSPEADSEGAPPTLELFDLTGQVECDVDGPPEYLEVAWRSTDAFAAYIGIDTADARASGLGIELPPTGSHRDFPDGRLEYPCGAATLVYTLTVVGADGETASLRETVKNVGDVW